MLELLQNVEVETPVGTTDYRMLTSGQLQLATLFLKEEVLSPMMVIDWIISGCMNMPLLYPSQVEYTLDDLKMLKQEAGKFFSPSFDYAKSNPTKEQPVAYEPPHRRNSWSRTWRTIGTQTTAFELMDWAQFQSYRRNSTNHIME